MQSSRPFKIFQRKNKKTYVEPDSYLLTSIPQDVKAEGQVTPFPQNRFDPQQPEIYSGSESEGEVHLNFKDIGSYQSSPTKHEIQSQSVTPSNQTISSVLEVNKIIQDFQSETNCVKNPSKKPKKSKLINKKGKCHGKVQIGEIYIGRLKKRDKIRRKVTINEVDEIYRCQCGKDYLSYMGIYRHIKNFHLLKDQYQRFRLHTKQDPKTGKILKTVIIEKGNNIQSIQKSANEHTERNVLEENGNIKLEDKSPEVQDLQLNYQEAIRQSFHFRQYPDVSGLEATISISKYERLMEAYEKILTQLFEKEQEYLQKTQSLIQQNSMLYQAKEKYKLKIKLLEIKLLSQKNNVQANEVSSNNPSPKDVTPTYENTTFECSESEQQSCQLPQFSSFNTSNVSYYDSQIEQVYSIGTKKCPFKKSSNNSTMKPDTLERGIMFDPEKQQNNSCIFEEAETQTVKLERKDTQTIASSGKTSQNTPYFKGYESDVETQYEDEECKSRKFYKSECKISRSHYYH